MRQRTRHRFLADQQLRTPGIDVAPGMIDTARAAHPDLRFEVAELTHLPADDSSLAGVAYWYSIITTPPGNLDPIWAELDRTLAPDGIALIEFQNGSGDGVKKTAAFGTHADLTLFLHDMEQVRTAIESASLCVQAVTERTPTLEHETSNQAFVLA